jgi:hypothetical protein
MATVELFASTRTQQGKTQNEDAFLIGRDPAPYAALCDGAGNAGRADDMTALSASADAPCNLYRARLLAPRFSGLPVSSSPPCSGGFFRPASFFTAQPFRL